jgi:hypothetical protein
MLFILIFRSSAVFSQSTVLEIQHPLVRYEMNFCTLFKLKGVQRRMCNILILLLATQTLNCRWRTVPTLTETFELPGVVP